MPAIVLPRVIDGLESFLDSPRGRVVCSFRRSVPLSLVVRPCHFYIMAIFLIFVMTHYFPLLLRRKGFLRSEKRRFLRFFEIFS